jgi:hypothetical protein
VAATCNANEREVLFVDGSATRAGCRALNALPFPLDACAATEVAVIFVDGIAVEEGGLCMDRGGGGPMARCQATSDCLEAGASCDPLFGGRLRDRWHLELPRAVDELRVCVRPCDTLTASEATDRVCLAGIAPPLAPVPPSHENRPSAGVVVPRHWLASLTPAFGSCLSPILLFDRQGDTARRNPQPVCTPPPRTATVGGTVIATPGFLGGLAEAACQSSTTGGVASHLAPLGWGLVCTQALQPVSQQNLDRVGCGRAGFVQLVANFTCASPAGLPSGAQVASPGPPPGTQCASGIHQNGLCGGRPRGGLCIADVQCAPGTTCDPATGRCGALAGFGTAALGDFDDPTVYRQCRANAYSQSQDICMAQPGVSTAAANCASGDVVGNVCAASGPGEFCGADADCGAGLACNIEERRCVSLTNTTSPAASSCASGVFNAQCLAGLRGDACVGSGPGTCSSGLACLERICR